jgi:uncharacterized protein (TIGR01244 family)
MKARSPFVPWLAVAAGLMFGAVFSGAAESSAKSPETKLRPLVFGSIERMHRFGDIYLSSQPSKEDFELAKEAGFRTVINLRKEEELDWDEKGAVEKLGMEYQNLGFKAPEELTDRILDEVRQLLASSDKMPILLHCSSANRVGAAWLAHRVLDGGLGFEDARLEAETVGLKLPAYVERARSYIGRRAKK